MVLELISLNKPENERLKLDRFIINKGLDFLLTFVHPTNTFKSYRYNIELDGIRVTVYYKEFYTDLKINIEGKIVSNITIISDNDYVPPLTVMGLMKNLILSQQDQAAITNEFERYVGKVVANMTSKELACAALTILWNI